MNEEKKKEILQWYEKGDHDIINVQLVLSYEPDIPDTACFHCQQAIEKYLKAYILFQGQKIIKTHNLIFLKESCSEFDDDFKKFDFKKLNEFGADIRYPDDYVVPSMEETRDFLQLAEDIKGLVMSKIILS